MSTTPQGWAELMQALQFIVDAWREANADTVAFDDRTWTVTIYGHRVDGADRIAAIGTGMGMDELERVLSESHAAVRGVLRRPCADLSLGAPP